jgi:hypothetical protein
MNPGSVLGSRPATAKLGARRRARQGYRAPRVRLRDTPDPGSSMERALEGDNPRRAPAARPSPAEARVERNGPPGGAKLRSGRAVRSTASPAFTGSGRHVRRTFGCVEATGLATARNRRPGSRARRGGESDREEPRGAAPDEGRRANPQGSNDPRERGVLPGEGKLWRGSTGTRTV